MKTRPTTSTHHEAGVSTLEFMIVLPVLLFVMLMIVEFSRAWMDLNVVTTAAREGARVAAVTPPNGTAFDPTPAYARIDQILGAANLSANATRTVTCDTSPCVSDSRVQSTVVYTFRTSFPVLLPMLSSINIQETAYMRYE